MATDIKKLQAKALQTGKDYTKTTDGEGGWQAPPEGPCGLRFVGYFEIGEHEKRWGEQTKRVKLVQLVFELSGKNYPAKDGVPQRMTITETDSRHVKSNLVKLFNKMNYERGATHFVELLGKAYRGRVHHREFEAGGQKRVYAGLRNDDGYSIGAPVMEVMDEATGDVVSKPMKVAEPLTELKCFLWDNPDAEQWALLYIEGEYAERRDDAGRIVRPARSKNVIQDKIRSALNWPGSPMQRLLEDGALGNLDGEEEDPPPAPKKKAPAKKETPKAAPAPADDDPLADLDDDIPY